jgi:hypothetical protein
LNTHVGLKTGISTWLRAAMSLEYTLTGECMALLVFAAQRQTKQGRGISSDRRIQKQLTQKIPRLGRCHQRV